MRSLDEVWTGPTQQETRAKNIKRRYNMTFDDLVTLLESQGYKCPITLEEIDEYHCSIDHEHSTGIVRGCLTSNANTSLGLLDDSVDNLERAIQYLKEYKEWRNDTVEH